MASPLDPELADIFMANPEQLASKTKMEKLESQFGYI